MPSHPNKGGFAANIGNMFSNSQLNGIKSSRKGQMPGNLPGGLIGSRLKSIQQSQAGKFPDFMQAQVGRIHAAQTNTFNKLGGQKKLRAIGNMRRTGSIKSAADTLAGGLKKIRRRRSGL